MHLLLDTHALLWAITENPSLSNTAQDAMRSRSNQIFVSAASAWEVATKFRNGKLPNADRLAADFSRIIIDELGFHPLSITLNHARSAGMLPPPHKDPFDRLLIAQALAEDLVLVSNEKLFDAYHVRRLW